MQDKKQFFSVIDARFGTRSTLAAQRAIAPGQIWWWHRKSHQFKIVFKIPPIIPKYWFSHRFFLSLFYSTFYFLITGSDFDFGAEKKKKQQQAESETNFVLGFVRDFFAFNQHFKENKEKFILFISLTVAAGLSIFLVYLNSSVAVPLLISLQCIPRSNAQGRSFLIISLKWFLFMSDILKSSHHS